ncbi:ESX secretion-associated protein EspG [Actinophytocola sp.]|uniref:ESX secretion-associated protein EspG n=1 Tax=Actinophytocola sp. TaxID=1872138 RepID=UPI00389984B7
MNAQSLLVGAVRFGFTLAPVDVSVLRQTFGVRSRLFPLRLGSTAVDPVRFAALAKAVDEALERRGLSADGWLNPSVSAGFELLAEHRVAVSITGAPGDLTVLAVSDDERAMTITQQSDEELRCELFPAAELVATVVAALPPAPAAEPPAGPDRIAAEPAEQSEPRLGGGLMVASGRGRHGRWSDMLGWVDTARGRRLVRTTSDRSGNFAARYTPAGRAELIAAVTTLLTADR